LRLRATTLDPNNQTTAESLVNTRYLNSLSIQAGCVASDDGAAQAITKQHVEDLRLRASTLNPIGETPVEKQVNIAYLNSLALQAGAVTSDDNAARSITKQHVEDLRLRASTLNPIGETPVEKQVNIAYLNSLALQAGAVTSDDNAARSITKQHVEDLRLRATTLNPTAQTANEKQENVDYLNTLSLQAGCVTSNDNAARSITKQHVEDLRLRATTLNPTAQTAAEKQENVNYLNTLSLQAGCVTSNDNATRSITKQHVEDLRLRATTLNPTAQTAAEKQENVNYLNTLSLQAGCVTSNDNTARNITKQHVEDLRLRATTLDPTNETASERVANLTYLNGLALKAGSLASSNNADRAITKTHVEDLRLRATTLNPDVETANEKGVNLAYINSLAVQAGSVTSTDVSARQITKQHVDDLDIDARSSKRLRLSYTSPIDSNLVQEDISENAVYIRSVLGIEPRHFHVVKVTRNWERAVRTASIIDVTSLPQGCLVV
jgi:hypothetical protein